MQGCRFRTSALSPQFLCRVAVHMAGCPKPRPALTEAASAEGDPLRWKGRSDCPFEAGTEELDRRLEGLLCSLGVIRFLPRFVAERGASILVHPDIHLFAGSLACVPEPFQIVDCHDVVKSGPMVLQGAAEIFESTRRGWHRSIKSHGGT